MTNKVHKMRLHPEPFSQIRDAGKTVEIRLLDEKRQGVQVGDRLVFVARADGAEIVSEVTELIHAKNFIELIDSLSAEELGVSDKEYLKEDVYTYYTKEEEESLGVIGIRFKVI